MPLLVTKLHAPPRRGDAVRRPRLLEQLSLGLDCPLTLISAPAGFGKTTLVSAWVHQGAAPPPDPGLFDAAWLALDPEDNDPVRFWQYVVAALQTVDETIGETTQAGLHAPQPPPIEPLVTALVNDLAARSSLPLVLVLDDYHVIQTEPIHSSLRLLLDHAFADLNLHRVDLRAFATNAAAIGAYEKAVLKKSLFKTEPG